MGQIRVDVDDFSLKSTYKCQQKVWDYYLGGVLQKQSKGASGHTESSTAKTTLKFDYALPDGAVVTGAKVYATLGSPLFGAHTSKINGVSVGTADTVSVDVEIAEGSTSVEVPVVFKCNAVRHDISTHSNASVESRTRTTVTDASTNVVYDVEIVTLSAQHVSSLTYDDVYLLIDYEGGEDTGGDDSGDTGDGVVFGGSQTVEADSFSLVSRYNCNTRRITTYTDGGATMVSVSSTNFTTDATLVQQTVTFSYDIPAGAVVKTAYVYADVGSPKYAADILTINGTPVSSAPGQKVEIVLPEGSGSVDVPFYFRTVPESHKHSGVLGDGTVTESYWGEWNAVNDTGNYYEWINFQHSSAVEFANVQLVIEYETQGAVGWELDKWEAYPGDTVTVSLTGGADAYERIVQVSIGGTVCEYAMPFDTTSVEIPVPMEWLEEMPNATSGVAVVTVTAYDVVTGEQVSQSSDNLTILCPDSVVPTMTPVLNRLLTVDGVTYPDVTGGYVQSKSGFEALIEDASGAYGSYITTMTIQALGRTTYDGTFASGLLDATGAVSIIYTVTDSRGRSVTASQTIIVEAYEPPSVSSFTVWRSNADGIADDTSAYAMYSFTPTYATLSGHNTLTASLTVAEQTKMDVPTSGWLLPGNTLAFEGAQVYGVDLTLTDAYESVSFAAIILPLTGTTVVIRPNRKRKRRLIIGDYDTVAEGDWTMTALSLPEPEYQSNFVTVPGRAMGALDMSTVLTDGVPTYGNRTLSARFECSAGTRQERNEIISTMVNQLDGKRWKIILPDDPDRYVVGRVSVKTEYSDMAHAAVNVAAVCEPWRYNLRETEISYIASAVEKEGILPNLGRRVLIPTVRVDGGSVMLTCGDYAWALTDGEYKLPELKLHPGNTPILFSGDGYISFVYREAVL